MYTVQVALIFFIPLLTMASQDNCTVTDRNVKVLEKLVKITKDLSTCPGEKYRVTLPGSVAFYASLVKTLTLSGTQNVVNDKVYTNYGSAYDAKHGVFKALETGLYFFTATIMNSSRNTQINIILMKNSTHKLTKALGKSGAYTGTTSAVIKLEKEDTISVQHLPSVGSQSIYGDEYCSFAGYLITALH